MGYLTAAYVLGVGAVVLYALLLGLERRRLEALARAGQKSVDKPARGEV